MPFDRRRGGSQMMMRGGLLDAYIRSLNPTLWLQMRETAGSTAFDSSGNNLDATITSATIGQTGKLGANHAYDFDGVDDLLTVVDAPGTLAAMTAFTYAFLVNPDTAGELSAGRLFQWEAFNTFLRFNSALTSIQASVDAATTDAVATGSEGLPADEWAWIFMTYDDAGDRTPHIYKGINGVVSEIGYSATQAADGTYTTLTGDLIIGNNASSAATTFDGQMDEIPVYNRVLTTAEMLPFVTLTGV